MRPRPHSPFRTAPSASSRGGPPASGHGTHTLRLWRGTLVGIHGDDVFVELQPRMQGVISQREFPSAPEVGQVHEFTLRGKEDRLWALALAGSATLATWETMEEGSLVEARVLRVVDGGLQLKVGQLHAFMPRSQCGLARGRKTAELLGKTLTCEVLEVDPQRQRVILSRRAVQRREREQACSHGTRRMRVGQIISGRVTRVETYGIFVAFGHGREGLVHVSNLRHEHVSDPAELYQVGEAVEAKILYLRQGGRRIGLGIRQLSVDPWRTLEQEHPLGAILLGTVTRITRAGVFVSLLPGVEGLIPPSECSPFSGRRGHVLHVGQGVSVRLADIDVEQRRASLSLTRSDGSAIDASDSSHADSKCLDFRTYRAKHKPLPQELPGSSALGTNLGQLLRRALSGDRAGDAAGTAS